MIHPIWGPYPAAFLNTGQPANTLSQARRITIAGTPSIFVPFVAAGANESAPSDGPTRMQEWHIYNFRLPYVLQVKLKPAAEQTAIKVIARVNFYLMVSNTGGMSANASPNSLLADVLYESSQEVELLGPVLLKAAEEGSYNLNAELAADLFNPIVLPNGRTLAMLAAFTINQATTTGTNTLELGGRREAPESGTSLAQGSLAYTTRELTGHRVLS